MDHPYTVFASNSKPNRTSYLKPKSIFKYLTNLIAQVHNPRAAKFVPNLDGRPQRGSKFSALVPDSPTVQSKYGGGVLSPPDTSSTENEEMCTQESDDELLQHYNNVETTPIDMDTPNTEERQWLDQEVLR